MTTARRRRAGLIALALTGVLGLAASCTDTGTETGTETGGGTGPAPTTGLGTRTTAGLGTGTAGLDILDATAQGPAPRASGARTGGTILVAYPGSLADLDPSAQATPDAGTILTRLLHRSLTSFAIRDGRPVLVPDLATDLGRASADGRTWTFTLKEGLKYSDGSAVTAQDIVYAVQRGFAFTDTGPVALVDYLEGGTSYRGPFESADPFPGVEAPDDRTVVFHLTKRWETLPYFASFSQVSPIRADKDPKSRAYGHTGPSTGPYVVSSFTAGTELVLSRNPNWDPNTDPARTAYVDSYVIRFAGLPATVQPAILAGDGVNASTLTWGPIDASLTEVVTGPKAGQLVTGPAPCVAAVNLDTRKIPLEVRRAIAVAYPHESIAQAAGVSPLSRTPAHTLVPPQLPGWLDYTLADLSGTGDGDPVRAGQLLTEAGYGPGHEFELSWYFTNDDPTNRAQAVNQVRKEKLQASGFAVRDMGVPAADRRARISQLAGPHNLGQSPAAWCLDWPSGDALFPATLSAAHVLAGGTNWGNVSESAIDAEMERIVRLPLSAQGPQWGAFDEWVMRTYLPVLPSYWERSTILFGTKVHGVVNDPYRGMPMIDAIWVDP